MRLLIVSRGLAVPEETQVITSMSAVWQGHEVARITANEFEAGLLADCETLVVAGLLGSEVPVQLDVVSALTNIMLDPALPVLSLGWGFELACLAYGCDLPDTYDLQEGATKLVPTPRGESLFQGSDPLRVSPAKRWPLDELPRGLAALAESETGIEAFQHRAKPLLALQQLPTDFVYDSDAKLVYENLLAQLRYTKK